MEKTWKPTTAGILCIIAGVIALIHGLVITVVGSIFLWMPWVWGGAVGILPIILGIMAIIGGSSALKRKNWGLALAGSICALIGPWVVLGILAIILLAWGRMNLSKAQDSAGYVNSSSYPGYGAIVPRFYQSSYIVVSEGY